MVRELTVSVDAMGGDAGPGIVITALILMVVGVALYRSIDALYFAIGVLLTSSLNIGKLFLLERTVRNTLEMTDQRTGKNYVRLQYILRYFLTGAILVGAGLITVYVDPPFINLWGALAGLFTLQIAVIIVRNKKLDDDGPES